MVLRIRDVLAALTAIYVARMAWDDPSESITATAHLSFYVAREEGTTTSSENNNKNQQAPPPHGRSRYLAPVLLDVDGDGLSEGMASAIYDTAQKAWHIQILDLKPAAVQQQQQQQQATTHLAPFTPQILYESDTIDIVNASMEDVQPISMTTGQVLLKPSASSPSSGSNMDASSVAGSKYKGITLDDKNRHYFCGTDWHEASEKCSAPCPGGQASECPSGERCYADTPCDVEQFMKATSSSSSSSFFTKRHVDITIDDLYVTPAGGLPSIFTLWSSGSVTMHSLTANATETSGDTNKQRRSATTPPLQVMPMWQTNIMGDKRPYAWSDLHVLYLDAIDAGNLDGILLVQAAVDFYPSEAALHHDDLDTMLFLTALDGRTGKIIWQADVLKSYTASQEEQMPLPMEPGTASTARRRSQIPFDLDDSGAAMVTNCLHNYRRSLLHSGALPYLYWGDEDAVVQALHFETTQTPAKPHAKAKQGHGTKQGQTKQNKNNHHHHNHNQHHPHRGKPNVVVSKTHRGLQVRSLRNGRSLCHVSLWHETLYADLNHDGVLDATFLMTGKHRLPGEEETKDMSEDEKWIYKLMLRVVQDEEARAQSRREHKMHHICHSMTLSGIPPREELFTFPLCEADHEQNEELPEVEPGPPLAVEAMRGRGHDLVLAVNNGILHRVRSNGRKQWEIHGRHIENFPFFEEGSYTLLDRINAKRVIPSTRPIVFTGDSSLALVAPRSGTVLSTAAFPQPVVQRPILMDFNGDGTTDILVPTADAFWGYQVTVRTGSSVFFRIVVGLLLMGVMLAILRNRFGPRPGKRSTDA